MTTFSRTVFVLGAGFTHAFVPKAPLLTDDYDATILLERFKAFRYALRILKLELNKNSIGHINIERLMTRLDGCMPYDFDQKAIEELGLLLSELKHTFVQKVEHAKKGPYHTKELMAFAKYCVYKGISCITFNYDDIFDEALWKVQKVTGMTHKPYWHPDGGYGFFCKPSETCIRDTNIFMDQPSEYLKMMLFKLHGSINWHIRRGYSKPYNIDAIVHHEPWLAPYLKIDVDPKIIALHLEDEPFIVPPVLMKSTLMEEPILRIVWSRAYKVLAEAEEIVFIGYSFPVTDIAANFLFSETLQHLTSSKIKVVNLASNDADQKEIKDAYRKVFPDIADEQFEFVGALEWSRRLVSTDL